LNLPRDHPRYWEQSIHLTGLNSSLFEEHIGKIQEIEEIFARSLPDDSLEPWTCHNIDGYESIGLANRYFTNQRYQDTDSTIAFSHEVDPLGILKNASKSGLVHSDDNEVQYIEVTSFSPEGKPKYVRVTHSL
jgi:hypothetical protein